MGRIFMNLKKKVTPGGILTLSLGYIPYMYMTFIVKQVYRYISQISGKRLQVLYFWGEED